MINNEKKAVQFMKSINTEADDKCEALRKETDKFVERELKKARKIAKENAKSIAKNELNKLDEQSNTDSYKSRTLQIKQIIEKRNEITDKVFEKATEKIKNFTASSSYEAFLEKSVNDIIDVIGKEAVIFIRPEDEKFSEKLSKLCAKVEFDKTIHIGGCKGVNTTTSMRADDTLDSRISQQRKEFYSMSGLSVTD